MGDFYSNTSSFIYSDSDIVEVLPTTLEEISLNNKGKITWLNTYGINYQKEYLQIIDSNQLDEFLKLLIKENKHRNKSIALEDSVFVALNTIHLNEKFITTEQMMFIVGNNFVWSLQEKQGDYFDNIRYRLKENKGFVRKKSSDYLLYLIVDAIIDNYIAVYEKIHKKTQSILDLSEDNLDQDYVVNIEKTKSQLFQLKKAITSLRDAIFKLEKTEFKGFEKRYYAEAKEQAHYLLDDIDFDLSQLESKLNLIFNLQNNRLNQVMKTLTIFSVIFIPLTFLAGIYGMNFDKMPGTKNENGFFIFLGATVIITLLSIYMIKKRNWFK